MKLRVFTVIWLKHYHAIFAKDKRYRLPWTMSALGCASRVSKWAEHKNYPDPIPFVFERGGEGWGLALENHRELEESGRLGKTKIGQWALDDKHVAGLQAADLWAWELRHHFQGQLPSNRPYMLRESLEKVMTVPDGWGFTIGGCELETMMEDLRVGASNVRPVSFCRTGLPMLIPEAL